MNSRTLPSSLPSSVFSFDPHLLSTPPEPLSSAQAFDIGCEIVAAKGQYGTISELARQYDVPRSTIEACYQRILALREISSRPYGFLPTIRIEKRHVLTAMILSRACHPTTFRALQSFGENFLGVSLSYGTIYQNIASMQRAAGDFLESVPLDCVKCVALDELFFHGKCLLVVIDLDTEFVCGLKVVDDLDADVWVDFLTRLRNVQGLRPRRTVSDAGSSVCPAIAEVFPFSIPSRDIFHAKRDIRDLFIWFEKRAYAAIKAEFTAAKNRAKAKPGELQEAAQRLRRAQEEAERAIEKHDRVLTLMEKAFEALELMDLGDMPFRRLPDGTLPVRDHNTLANENVRAWEVRFRRGSEAAAMLKDVANSFSIMKEARAQKVGRYLTRQLEPLVSYLDQLAVTLQNLASDHDEQAAVLIFAALYRIDRMLQSGQNAWKFSALGTQRRVLVESLAELDVAPGRLADLTTGTVQAIRACGRASSMVECFNSVSRPYVNSGKRLSEGTHLMLAARWNLAPRASGRLKNTTPYTELTGKEVGNWLELLQPPQANLPSPGGPQLTVMSGYLPRPGHDDGHDECDPLEALLSYQKATLPLAA